MEDKYCKECLPDKILYCDIHPEISDGTSVPECASPVSTTTQDQVGNFIGDDKGNASKCWFMTLDVPDVPNKMEYTKNFFKPFYEHFSEIYWNYEKGETTGLEHMQVCCKLLVKKRRKFLSDLFANTGILRDVIRPVKFWPKAKNYCQKIETALASYQFPEKVKTIDKHNFFPWQKDIYDLLMTEPDDRKITWIYDETGNNGKTSLLKYLAIHENALFMDSGTKGDMMNYIFNYYKKNGPPKIIIITLPRDFDMNKFNYCAVESIKDGLCLNNKYECNAIAFNSPHVIILCNSRPDMSAFTIDRWNIKSIDDEHCLY